MSRNLLRRFALGLAIPLLLVGTIMFFSASRVSASSFTFTNFELGDFNPPGAPGTVCPQSTESQACTNYAAEPAIRANPAGNFYASSEHGLGGGTDAWRSSDGGRHYVGLAISGVAQGGQACISCDRYSFDRQIDNRHGCPRRVKSTPCLSKEHAA